MSPTPRQRFESTCTQSSSPSRAQDWQCFFCLTATKRRISQAPSSGLGIVDQIHLGASNLSGVTLEIYSAQHSAVKILSERKPDSKATKKGDFLPNSYLIISSIFLEKPISLMPKVCDTELKDPVTSSTLLHLALAGEPCAQTREGWCSKAVRSWAQPDLGSLLLYRRALKNSVDSPLLQGKNFLIWVLKTKWKSSTAMMSVDALRKARDWKMRRSKKLRGSSANNEL